MTRNTPPPQALLIGHPVSHSLSPRIMAALSKKTGHALDYKLQDIEPASLDEKIREIRSTPGLVGLNFTVPHKGAGALLADSRSPAVNHIGSANLWTRSASGFCAHNSDGPAFVASLDHSSISLRGREIVMLGAGGAARGVAYACLASGAERVWVWNRTADNVQKICAINPKKIVPLYSPEDLTAPVGLPRLVINATSLGLSAADAAPLERLTAPLKEHLHGSLSTDLVYSAQSSETLFLKLAKEWGLPTVETALSMLLLQAVFAFNRWTGSNISVKDALQSQRAILNL